MTSACCRRGWCRLTAVAVVFHFGVAFGRVGRCIMCTGEYEFSGTVRSDEVDVVFLKDVSCALGEKKKKKKKNELKKV